MKAIARSASVGFTLLLASAHLAAASDHRGYSYKSVVTDADVSVPVPAPMPIPEHGDFYIRGDFGFAVHPDPDMAENNVDYTEEGAEDGSSAAFGVGYNFRDRFRGDITIDYRWDIDLKGVDATQVSLHETTLDTLAVLGNLYFDFAGRGGFTPYVGIGMGIAHHDTSQRVVTVNGAQTTGGGRENVDIAAAAMAGFSYTLHDGLLFDAGYRFLYLGDAGTAETVDGVWAEQEIKNISAHELRVGIRYEIY